jgi:hypothetical protein
MKEEEEKHSQPSTELPNKITSRAARALQLSVFGEKIKRSSQSSCSSPQQCAARATLCSSVVVKKGGEETGRTRDKDEKR